MTPREEAIKQLNEKVIIKYGGELAYLIIGHSAYGTPESVDEFIVDELRKLNATHLIRENKFVKFTNYYLNGDISDIRSNKDYILAVLRAKKVVKRLAEDASDVRNYRDTETNNKEIFIIELNSRPVVEEYDGKEDIKNALHIWKDDEIDTISMAVEEDCRQIKG